MAIQSTVNSKFHLAEHDLSGIVNRIDSLDTFLTPFDDQTPINSDVIATTIGQGGYSLEFSALYDPTQLQHIDLPDSPAAAEHNWFLALNEGSKPSVSSPRSAFPVAYAAPAALTTSAFTRSETGQVSGRISLSATGRLYSGILLAYYPASTQTWTSINVTDFPTTGTLVAYGLSGTGGDTIQLRRGGSTVESFYMPDAGDIVVTPFINAGGNAQLRRQSASRSTGIAVLLLN